MNQPFDGYRPAGAETSIAHGETVGGRAPPASASHDDHRPYVARYITNLVSIGHMWPEIFSEHRQTITLEKPIKAHHRAQDLVAEVDFERQP